MSLVNMHFIVDYDDGRFRTGVIVDQINNNYYLAKFESLDEGCTPPLEVVSVAEMTKMVKWADQAGASFETKSWSLFSSREAVEAWIALMDKTDPVDETTATEKVVPLRRK